MAGLSDKSCTMHMFHSSLCFVFLLCFYVLLLSFYGYYLINICCCCCTVSWVGWIWQLNRCSIECGATLYTLDKHVICQWWCRPCTCSRTNRPESLKLSYYYYFCYYDCNAQSSLRTLLLIFACHRRPEWQNCLPETVLPFKDYDMTWYNIILCLIQCYKYWSFIPACCHCCESFCPQLDDPQTSCQCRYHPLISALHEVPCSESTNK